MHGLPAAARPAACLEVTRRGHGERAIEHGWAEVIRKPVMGAGHWHPGAPGCRGLRFTRAAVALARQHAAAAEAGA